MGHKDEFVKDNIDSSPRLYELHKGDRFSASIDSPPLGIPVVIVDTFKIRRVKWYKPLSWFRKTVIGYIYEYIGERVNGS